VIPCRDPLHFGDRSHGMDIFGSRSIDLSFRQLVSRSVEGRFHVFCKNSSLMSSTVPAERSLVHVDVRINNFGLVGSGLCDVVSSIAFLSSLS
jgi:hypothetical protein